MNFLIHFLFQKSICLRFLFIFWGGATSIFFIKVKLFAWFSFQMILFDEKWFTWPEALYLFCLEVDNKTCYVKENYETKTIGKLLNRQSCGNSFSSHRLGRGSNYCWIPIGGCSRNAWFLCLEALMLGRNNLVWNFTKNAKIYLQDKTAIA